MRRAMTLAGLCILAASVSAAAPAERRLIIFAPDREDARLARQRDAFGGQAAALRDYRLSLVVVTAPDDPRRKALGVAPPDFAAILVGYDGGAKQRWTAPVAPGVVYSIIDTMPMRRREVRGRA